MKKLLLFFYILSNNYTCTHTYPYMPHPYELTQVMGTQPYDLVRGQLMHQGSGAPIMQPHPLTQFVPYVPHMQPIIIISPSNPSLSNTMYCATNVSAQQSHWSSTYFGMLEEYKNKIMSALGVSKKSLFVGSIVIGYAALLGVIIRGNHYLRKTDTWSSWRMDLTLEQLLSFPQRELAESLVFEVQTRYPSQHTSANFVNPLITFVKAIDEELEQISFYERFFSWLVFCKVSMVLPIDTKLIDALPNRIRRLTYLKNTLLSWSANYCIDRISSLPAQTFKQQLPPLMGSLSPQVHQDLIRSI